MPRALLGHLDSGGGKREDLADAGEAFGDGVWVVLVGHRDLLGCGRVFVGDRVEAWSGWSYGSANGGNGKSPAATSAGEIASRTASVTISGCRCRRAATRAT